MPLRLGGQKGAEERVAEFELDVLPAGAAKVPVEVEAVGDGGHEGEGVAGGPGGVVVLGDGGVGVAAGVGGVVPGAVVVGGPVQELEVGVGAAGVEVEEVREAHLADVEVEAALGGLCGEGELGAVDVDELVGEADGLVELDAGDVGLGAEVGVADDVEVGEAGEAERLRDAAAAGGLDVEDEVGGGAGSLWRSWAPR